MSPVKEKKNMKKDVTKKRCLSDNERYADLINGVVFKGKQKIHAEDGYSDRIMEQSADAWKATA